MEDPSTNPLLEAEFIKDTQASVPDIIKNLNPVMEHFDTIPKRSGEIEIPDIDPDPNYLHRLLTKAEQALCDMATD